METIKTQYVSLDVLAVRLGLPSGYLRTLAVEKKIPHLSIGGRLKFNPAAVQAALDRLAEQGGCNGK